MMNKVLSVGSMVLTLMVPFVVYFLSISERSLSYEVISNVELINHYEGLSDSEIQLMFGNRAVENVALSIVRIINTGSEPIRKNDFESSINIIFGPDAEILRAKILNKTPENLSINLSFDEIAVSIKPLLINAEDSFEVEVLSTTADLLEVEARIAGINEVKEIQRDSKNEFRYYSSIILGLMLVAMYGSLFWRAIRVSKQKYIDFIMAIICCCAGILLLREWSTTFSTNLLFMLVLILLSSMGGVMQLWLVRKSMESRESSGSTI